MPNNTDNNDSARHLTLKEIQEDVRHSSDKAELVAIAEEASNRPKKRSRRAARASPNATPADPAGLPTGYPAAGEPLVVHIAIAAPSRQQLIPMPIIYDKMHLTKCCHLMITVLSSTNRSARTGDH